MQQAAQQTKHAMLTLSSEVGHFVKRLLQGFVLRLRLKDTPLYKPVLMLPCMDKEIAQNAGK